MIKRRALQPRRADEALQGKILQGLLERSQTTLQLVETVQRDIQPVRRELIRLHHLGVIEPLGIRGDTTEPGAKLYYRDLLWGITDHGMSHHTSVSGCMACYLRERRLLAAGGYI